MTKKPGGDWDAGPPASSLFLQHLTHLSTAHGDVIHAKDPSRLPTLVLHTELERNLRQNAARPDAVYLTSPNRIDASAPDATMPAPQRAYSSTVRAEDS